jgi:uncharacterized protein (TIGR01319 family)
MMAEEKRIGSILLADCGTVMTKAVLLDRVAGRYHFVAQGEAPTTAEFPWGDISAGVRHAVQQIAEVTGRKFFDASGNLICPELEAHQGVDIFAATVSASQPVQVVVDGLVHDLSVASAERAAASTYALVKTSLSADAARESATVEDHVRAIYDAAPDVVFVVGGTEDGAIYPVLEIVEAASLACELMADAGVRPRVLFAGNSRLRQRVASILDGQVELRVADNVRPTLVDEYLAGAQAELDALYVQEKMAELPGLEMIGNWSRVPVMPTAQAFGRLIQYLWHLGDPTKGVLGLDLGGASLVLAAAFDGQLSLAVRSDLGVAFSGEEFLERHGAELISRWMQEPMSTEQLRALFINKAVRPATIPQVPRELWAEQALAREMIRTALEMVRPGWRPGSAQVYDGLMPSFETIVVSGGVLARAPRPGQTALLVLDAVQPIGLTTLVLDAHGLAPALGNVAVVKPLAAVEALDSGGLTNLATAVVPAGHARRGDTVLRVRMTYDDGGSLEVEVRYGDLEVLPLPPSQEAVLELRPQRHFDVGLGGPGKGGRRRVSGSLVGVVIDARGRPLDLPRRAEDRQEQMRQWLWDVGG